MLISSVGFLKRARFQLSGGIRVVEWQVVQSSPWRMTIRVFLMSHSTRVASQQCLQKGRVAAGIEGVAESVAEEFKAQNHQRDGCAGTDGQPGVGGPVRLGPGEHCTPLGNRWISAQAEERQASHFENGSSQAEAGEH